MDRPLDSKPILGYAVASKSTKTLVTNHIYSSPGVAIAAIGEPNYILIQRGFVDQYATPKEFKVARKAAFDSFFTVYPVYIGESI